MSVTIKYVFLQGIKLRSIVDEKPQSQMRMQSKDVSSMLISVDTAWLCAAERDIEREEREHAQILKNKRLHAIKGKYELDTAAQLDADLKQQQLELQRKIAKRKQNQLPTSSIKRFDSIASPKHPQNQENQSQSRSIYELENIRLHTLMTEKHVRNKLKRCVYHSFRENLCLNNVIIERKGIHVSFKTCWHLKNDIQRCVSSTCLFD